MYIREEFSEEYYKFLWRTKKEIRGLPLYGDFIAVEEKIGLLEKLGITEVGVWCEDEYVGEVSVRDCKPHVVNNVVSVVDFEIRNYIKAYQQSKRERESIETPGPVQGTFTFTSFMGGWKFDMSNTLRKEDISWVR